MSATTIGGALVEKRHELGLEKGQAAEKIGMSRTTYSSYEQDTQRPSVDVFPALAEFLSISIEELLTLYGATCIASVRPSLERVVGGRADGIAETKPLRTDDERGRAEQTDGNVTTRMPSAEPDSIGSDDVAEVEVVAAGDVHNSDETEVSLELAEATDAVELTGQSSASEAAAAEESRDLGLTDFEAKAYQPESDLKSPGHKKKKKKRKKK